MDMSASFMFDAKVSFMDLTPDGDSAPSTILVDPNDRPPMPVHIFSEGDLWLITKSKTFLVSSTALSLASPVFSIFLQQNLPPPTPSQKQAGRYNFLRMDGDHPDSLEVILNVIHFRGQRSIPTVVSSEGLFKIGIIAHKYELGSAVRSWAYRWLRQIAWKDKIQDAVRWMALSWVLRDEGTFQHMTRFLIRNGKYLVTDGGERVLVDAEGNRMAVEGAPWVVIEAIESAIEDMHRRMSQTAQKVLMAYWNAPIPICRGYVTSKAIACDRLQLAGLMHHLKKIGMDCILNLPADPSSNNSAPPGNTGNPRLLPPLDSRRRTADKLLASFRNVAENFSSELGGSHLKCSPFPELYELLRQVDTPGLDLWQLVETLERMKLQEQHQRERQQEQYQQYQQQQREQEWMGRGIGGMPVVEGDREFKSSPSFEQSGSQSATPQPFHQ